MPVCSVNDNKAVRRKAMNYFSFLHWYSHGSGAIICTNTFIPSLCMCLSVLTCILKVWPEAPDIWSTEKTLKSSASRYFKVFVSRPSESSAKKCLPLVPNQIWKVSAESSYNYVLEKNGKCNSREFFRTAVELLRYGQNSTTGSSCGTCWWKATTAILPFLTPLCTLRKRRNFSCINEAKLEFH